MMKVGRNKARRSSGIFSNSLPELRSLFGLLELKCDDRSRRTDATCDRQSSRGHRYRPKPFGCAIARGDELIAVAHNTVVATTDVTAHAEVNALRLACKTTGQIHLDGCVVATTCEPCPMCMAALHWARVETVYFGASIADADAAGFNELQVPAADA